jgi:hypothetical protein
MTGFFPKPVRFAAFLSIAIAAAALTTKAVSGYLVLGAAAFRFLGFALKLNEDRKEGCGVTPFIDKVMFLAAILAVVSVTTELRQEFAIPAVVLAFVAAFLLLQEEETECSALDSAMFLE